MLIIKYIPFITFIALGAQLAVLFKTWLFAKKNKGKITSISLGYIVITIFLFIVDIIFIIFIPFEIIKLCIFIFFIIFLILII